MPKKTRKEKIIKNLRRKITAFEEKPAIYQKQADGDFKKTAEKEKTKVQKFVPSKQEISFFVESQNDKTRLFKKDLLKTFILASLAITVELVLYFVGKRG